MKTVSKSYTCCIEIVHFLFECRRIYMKTNALAHWHGVVSYLRVLN